MKSFDLVNKAKVKWEEWFFVSGKTWESEGPELLIRHLSDGLHQVQIVLVEVVVKVERRQKLNLAPLSTRIQPKAGFESVGTSSWLHYSTMISVKTISSSLLFGGLTAIKTFNTAYTVFCY